MRQGRTLGIVIAGMLLSSILVLGAAYAESGSGWIYRPGVWLERTDAGVRIHYATENPKSDATTGELQFRIADLDGFEMLSKAEQITVQKGRAEGVMDIALPLDPARISKSFLEYRLKTRFGEERAAFRLIDVLPQLETRLLGSGQFLVGSKASLRLVALNHATGQPVAGAAVEVRLKTDAEERALLSATTNADGALDTPFEVPGDLAGRAELRIKVTAAGLGEDEIVQPVTVARKTRVLLTTDKPLYQPGQIIHLRALAMDMGTGTPAAAQPLLFEVMDGKGNKVFKKSLELDAYGVAFADFQLATEVNLGAYVVRATVGEEATEKQVTVDRYVLPKFEVKVETDREAYRPGEALKGTIQSDYFFGKPVAGGRVTVTASKFEAGFEEFAKVEGVLDENGHWEFEIKLPDYFAGTPIEQGQASARLETVVVDTADHREEKVVMKPVAAQALMVHVVPEAGSLRPGLENRVYVFVAQPDGAPAGDCAVSVEVAGLPAPKEMKTDAVGIAEFTVTPSDENPVEVKGRAKDRQGREADFAAQLTGVPGAAGLILRPEQVLYNVGDALRAEIITTKETGTVYFDLIRDGQAMMTRSAEIAGGHATLELDLDAALSGTLVLRAYIISAGGDTISDARRLYVNPADALNIGIALDAETYRPGDKATLRFAVTGRDGHPTAAALGISIVDESVFALQEIHPGLEKIYFTLEKEIMQPRFEIHGFDIDSLVVEPAQWKPEQQQAARVLFASAPDLGMPSMDVNTFKSREMEANSAIAARIQKDVEHVQKAIERLLEKEDKVPEDLLSVLLRKRYLRENELLDPWGRRYEFDFSNISEWGGSFQLLSYGPDGIKGTSDDISPDTNFGRAMIKMGAMDMNGDGAGGGVGGAFVRGKRVPMPAMAEAMAPMAMDSIMLAGNVAGAGGGEPAVRVREYFPETLLFEPALITDANGAATLEVPMADSITTWRMTTMASAANGALGSKDAPIRVFQDFFVDIDLPVALTQHDRVSIPVVLYNYLDTPQDIRIRFEQAPWFKLEGPAEQTITVGVGDVVSRYFPIEVVELGMHKLTVFADGSKLSDAIRREIEVRPDGEEKTVSFSDRLSGPVTHTITIPGDAIPGASTILVRVYPGVFTQIVDGLDKMLQMPFGCFEQTSSTTYPNILIVQYMKDTKQINPEIQMTAEGFINAGYQRLLSYEVDGGGFSWFGDAPANQVLTAWGVKEFQDMAKVYEIDENVIARTREWLFSQQQPDGSWKPDASYLHEESWGNVQKSGVLVTAYIADALLGDVAPDPRAVKAIEYLRAHWEDTQDPYTLGIVANALVSWKPRDAFTGRVLETLYNLRKEDEKTVHWESEEKTVTFSHGDGANVEATALATIAFLKAGRYPEAVTKALTYLVQKKSAEGHWGSTQATILALKAMILSLGSQTEKVNAEIAVKINGEEASRLTVTPEDSDVLRLVDLKDKTRAGDNTVELSLTGEGSMLYQVVGRFYTPWQKKPAGPDPLSIDVAYDKTALAVNDIITTTVRVTNNVPAAANMIIVDLGIPPGFDVTASDLDALVAQGVFQKYELTGRQVIVYFEKIDGGKTIEFKYTLRARFPLRAQTPASRVYEYYNPEVGADAAPVELEVK